MVGKNDKIGNIGSDVKEDILKYLKENTDKLVVNESGGRKKLSIIFENTKYKILENKSNNPFILGRFKAVIIVLNKVTQNGTLYTTEWANNSIFNNAKFKDRMRKKLVIGRLDHPAEASSSVESASHSLVDVELKGNEVWGTFEVFNTKPYGENLWVLLNAGVVLGLSIRGLGDEIYVNGVKKIDDSNFELIGIDVVVDASSVGSEFKEFVEGKIDVSGKFINELKILNDRNIDKNKLLVESLVREEKYRKDISRLKSEKERYVNGYNELVKRNDELVKKLEEMNKLNEKYRKKFIMIKESVENNNSRLKNEVDSYKRLVDSKNEIIEDLKSSIVSKDNEIRVYKEELLNLKKIVEKYKSNVMESRNSNINVVIKEKDGRGVVEDGNDNLDFIKKIIYNKNGFLRKK